MLDAKPNAKSKIAALFLTIKIAPLSFFNEIVDLVHNSHVFTE